MDKIDVHDWQRVVERIRAQTESGNYRLTQHAQQEMAEEDIPLDEVLEAIVSGSILENYPEHRRGSCCLINGLTRGGRPLHIVTTTTLPILIVITAYEPKPPKWVTPTQRRG